MVLAAAGLLVLGLVLLVAGAESLVRGGSALASRFGLSKLLIGLTVVAIGTSAPELVVSAVASYEGNGEVALGNVAGSNVLNVLIVLGAAAVVAPVSVQRLTVRRDIPLVIVASLAAMVFAGNGTVGRLEGALLAAGVVAYVVHAYRQGREAVQTPATRVGRLHPAAQAALVAVGIALLVLGGSLVVDSATAIAASAGVSDRVIAITLVAFGTSLPELATSLVAAARREMDIAVGNITGSNLFNILLVLGVSALVRPVTAPWAMRWIDLPVMTGAALLLLPLARSGFRLTRWEGGLLLAAYAAYATALLAGWFPTAPAG